MKLSNTSVTALCLVAICGTALKGTTWKTFKSEKYHFSVTYPPSWHGSNHETEILEIFDFPSSERVKGVVIPRSGAGITVVPAIMAHPKDTVNTISDWIEKDLVGTNIVSRKELKTLSQEAGACTELVEVQTDAEEGPNAYTHATSYYCRTRTGLYRVELSNWRGNPKQSQLQAIAGKIVLSLRSW